MTKTPPPYLQRLLVTFLAIYVVFLALERLDRQRLIDFKLFSQTILGLALALIISWVMRYRRNLVKLLPQPGGQSIVVGSKSSLLLSTTALNFLSCLVKTKSVRFRENKIRLGQKTITFLLILSGIAFSTLVSLYTSGESPLIVTQKHPHPGFILGQANELLAGDKLTGGFLATEDNLGILAIRFNTFNRFNNDILTFRIKSQGAQDWHYQNDYQVGQFQNNELFPFGFPKIPDSKGKTYYFEIESLKGKPGNAVAISLTSPLSETTYQFSRQDLFKRKTYLVKFALTKLFSSFKGPGLVITAFSIFLPLGLYSLAKTYHINYLRYAFLFLLALTLASTSLKEIGLEQLSLVTLDLPQKGRRLLILLTVIVGGLTAWRRRESQELTIKQYEHELEKARKRAIKFLRHHPRLHKIPLLGQFALNLYKEGLANIMLLAVILAVFTIIKAPYFNNIFAGEHGLKYNTYVEPALYMLENNNPFWRQSKYYVNPIRNPQGIYQSFESLPLMEWGLLLTYKLSPVKSIEFNTRIVTNTIGLLILISAYVFFKYWLPQKLSLLIVFLMAINPIVSFATFVTVYDSWAMLFTFISLISLNQYLETKCSNNLFWAGIFFGIGNTVRNSLFLWLAPLSLAIMFLRKKSVEQLFQDYLIYLTLSILPLITFKTSLANLPSQPAQTGLASIVWLGVYIMLWFILKTHREVITSLLGSVFKFIGGHKFVMIASFYYLGVATYITLRYLKLTSLMQAFLTNTDLILNFDMYKYMLLEQFKPYMTTEVFYLGLLGITTLFISKNKNFKVIATSFAVASLFFWISASKVIFFHNYYTMIIMITFIILTSYVIYITSIGQGRLAPLSLFLFLLLIFPSSYNANTERLSQIVGEDGLENAATYLRDNTDEDELFIQGPSTLLALGLKARRGSIGGAITQESELLRKSIEKMGFKKTMSRYNIRYLITYDESPNYRRYLKLFTNKEVKVGPYTRTSLILSTVRNEASFYGDFVHYLNIEEINKLVQELDIKKKFQLERQIGGYRFYTFRD